MSLITEQSSALTTAMLESGLKFPLVTFKLAIKVDTNCYNEESHKEFLKWCDESIGLLGAKTDVVDSTCRTTKSDGEKKTTRTPVTIKMAFKYEDYVEGDAVLLTNFCKDLETKAATEGIVIVSINSTISVGVDKKAAKEAEEEGEGIATVKTTKNIDADDVWDIDEDEFDEDEEFACLVDEDEE